MEKSKKYKSKYGNVFYDLPTIKVNVLEIDKVKDYCFLYEINKDVGIKDNEGRKKMIFKMTFTMNTNYLKEKWAYVKKHFKEGKEMVLPYKISNVNGQKYLNLIFKNEYFAVMQKENEKREKTIEDMDEDLND